MVQTGITIKIVTEIPGNVNPLLKSSSERTQEVI